jgi:anti-sigma regulatory factor (Ser/Thr protein kinase)
MARQVLFVGETAAPAEAALVGWRVTRVGEAQLALTWLRHNPPDLILVGSRDPFGGDFVPSEFVLAVKTDHAGSLLPLVQVRASAADGVRAEPDAWLDLDRTEDAGASLAEALAARAERQREGARADLRLSVPSDVGLLEEVHRLLGAWFAACGFGGMACNQLNLAVRELAANAIEWGHGHDRSRTVSLWARLDEEKVSVLVADDGPGFDPTATPHAARPGDPLEHLAVRSALGLRDGGFGILMTRGMVDQLCYNAAGNEAQVVKYLPRKQAGARAQGAVVNA